MLYKCFSINIIFDQQVLFEGVRGTSYTGDIAIDDFKLMDGACNQPGACDFEKDDWCTWTNADREDKFDWLVGSGATPSFSTGPSTDHTTGLFVCFVNNVYKDDSSA